MKKIIRIENLCCPNCAAKLEEALKKTEGVQNCVVSFLAQKIVLEMDDAKAESILAKLPDIAKNIEPDAEITF